jgi:hypothetical protein
MQLRLRRLSMFKKMLLSDTVYPFVFSIFACFVVEKARRQDSKRLRKVNPFRPRKFCSVIITELFSWILHAI